MEHFYNDIQGWFDFEPFYLHMVLSAPDRGRLHFVEVGSWKGKSAAFMAVEIANSKKDIFFDCVDTFKGSDEAEHRNDKDIQRGTLLQTFQKNMLPAIAYYHVIAKPSVVAARMYPNEELDMVFIDASREYEDVKADLKAWHPKIKSGGTLAGSNYNSPGVKKAVDEYFPTIWTDGTWEVTKP